MNSLTKGYNPRNASADILHEHVVMLMIRIINTLIHLLLIFSEAHKMATNRKFQPLLSCSAQEMRQTLATLFNKLQAQLQR